MKEFQINRIVCFILGLVALLLFAGCELIGNGNTGIGLINDILDWVGSLGGKLSFSGYCLVFGIYPVLISGLVVLFLTDEHLRVELRRIFFAVGGILALLSLIAMCVVLYHLLDDQSSPTLWFYLLIAVLSVDTALTLKQAFGPISSEEHKLRSFEALEADSGHRGLTFPQGGVHPASVKLSRGLPIEVLPLPDVVTIPLAQHIGAPAVAKVAKGDKVLTGQLIAEAGSFMSANIHSPVSGTVTAVDMVVNGQGLRQMMITIKREGDDWVEGIDRSDALVKVCPFSAQEIIAKIKDAGIVGMGGATFPTHVKLSVPPGKKAEVVIINGVECEPYLTSDHRTMLEHGEELVMGVTILMKAVGVGKACIGIENNKPDAIAHLRRIVAGYSGIEVVPLKVMYPQGGEKQLIAAVTGRQVPPPPALPIDVGAVVCNASTALAVYQAVLKNKPLIERVVTVTGKSVKEPKNLLTRMGTPVSALLEAAGGLPEDAGKVINGGPMMGRAMVNLDSPVTKGCSGITVMSGRDAQRREATQCIKCAKCVSACPMGLEPYYLSKMTQKKGWDELETLMITSCIECGCCQSTCPAYLPLLDWVRLGKQTVMGLIRARAAAAPKK